MNIKLRLLISLCVLVFSLNAYAFVEIKPNSTYVLNYNNLTSGNYVATCNFENPYHYARPIDMNISVNGITQYIKLDELYFTYKKDFIRGNQIEIKIQNLDNKYPIDLISCEIHQTFNKK